MSEMEEGETYPAPPGTTCLSNIPYLHYGGLNKHFKQYININIYIYVYIYMVSLLFSLTLGWTKKRCHSAKCKAQAPPVFPSSSFFHIFSFGRWPDAEHFCLAWNSLAEIKSRSWSPSEKQKIRGVYDIYCIHRYVTCFQNRLQCRPETCGLQHATAKASLERQGSDVISRCFQATAHHAPDSENWSEKASWMSSLSSLSSSGCNVQGQRLALH